MRSHLHLHRLRAVPAAVLALAAAQAGAQSYTFTDLGVLAGTTSSGRGINAAGVVVGRSTISDGSTSAALWKNGGTLFQVAFNTLLIDNAPCSPI